MSEKTPSTDILRRMSYSDLKKEAKKHGIKGNMKAQKIIAALSLLNYDDESFSTPVLKEINSSKKNKEKEFDKGCLTPIATPRRGTYSLESSTVEEEKAGLNSETSDDVDCFSTPAAQQMNSSRKNKEDKFDEDSITPLPTPRRGTFSIETPSSLKVEVSLSESATVDGSVLDMSNVSTVRGSERKLRPRRVSFRSPMKTPSSPKNLSLKLRPKTPRRSLAKQVSFSTPVQEHLRRSFRTTPHPINSVTEEDSSVLSATFNEVNDSSPVSNVADLSVTTTGTAKPQDDKVSSTSSTEENAMNPVLSEADVGETTPNVIQEVDGSRTISSTSSTEANAMNPVLSESDVCENTPNVIQEIYESRTNSVNRATKGQVSVKKTKFATPASKRSLRSHGYPDRMKRTATPIFTKSLQPKQYPDRMKRTATPISTKASVTKKASPTRIKRTATPNFKKIHEKAFEKMESIDDYKKRKEMNSAKKRSDWKPKVANTKCKIPTFSGIPFLPSVSGFTSQSRFNAQINKVIASEGSVKSLINVKSPAKIKRIATPNTKDVKNAKAGKENTSHKKKKFDLQASLSRKLGYKPYTGPLKPLAESNTVISSSVHKTEMPHTKISKNRIQTRSALKGVRTNKRFELQMKNRRID